MKDLLAHVNVVLCFKSFEAVCLAAFVKKNSARRTRVHVISKSPISLRTFESLSTDRVVIVGMPTSGAIARVVRQFLKQSGADVLAVLPVEDQAFWMGGRSSELAEALRILSRSGFFGPHGSALYRDAFDSHDLQLIHASSRKILGQTIVGEIFDRETNDRIPQMYAYEDVIVRLARSLRPFTNVIPFPVAGRTRLKRGEEDTG